MDNIRNYYCRQTYFNLRKSPITYCTPVYCSCCRQTISRPRPHPILEPHENIYYLLFFQKQKKRWSISVENILFNVKRCLQGNTMINIPYKRFISLLLLKQNKDWLSKLVFGCYENKNPDCTTASATFQMARGIWQPRLPHASFRY